jgi:pSer/pThr/pTyr-binding forkhead associated (FHA) protein
LNESKQHGSNSDDIESTRNYSEDLLGKDIEKLSDEEQQAVDSLPSGNALLIVRRGPNKGSRFLLDSDLITVGRHPNADIFLDDVTVSRRHAEIKRSAARFTITDLASLNGTYYEGSRIETQTLADGAELQVGKYHFTFYAAKRDI